MDPASSVGEQQRGTTGRSAALVVALFVALALLLLWPAIRSGDRLGGKDWNAFIGQAQAEAETLLQWGQFPAWNPWRRGGQVSFAQPESMLLTPITPLVLWLGAPLAFKLLLVPLFVVCGLGLFALARDLGLRGAAALIPGVTFVCAGPLSLYVNGGLPNWLCGMALLPWLLLASRRAATSRRWLVGGGMLFALLLFAGSVHHFVFFPIVLAIEAAGRALRERSVRPLLASAAMGIVGASLSAVRLVPLLELFSEFPRRIDSSGRFMPLELMVRSLLLPHPPAIEERLHVTLEGGSVLYWVDCGAFVGPLISLLAVAALFVAWRRAWPFVALAAVFAWMAAGSSVQPSLWDALHRLPVYASMQAPERFMGYVVFAIALLAGFGGERVLQIAARRGKRASRFAAPLLLLAVAAPLVWCDASLAKGAFPVAPPNDVAPTTLFSAAVARPPFVQSRFPDIKEQWGGPLFESVLCNVGNVDGQSDVESLNVTRGRDDPEYRGEAYLADRRGRVEASFTPNVIRVQATVDADDVLVINQNFFPGWRERQSGRACVSRDGLLALPLTAGTHELELGYASPTFPWAAGASGGVLLLVVIWWWCRCRRQQAELVSRVARVPRVPRVVLLPGGAAIDRTALALLTLLVAAIVGWHATRRPGGAMPSVVPWREQAVYVSANGDPQALQLAVDAAPVGAILRLAPENFGDVVIRRGVTIVADPPGAARVASVRVEELPAGQTVVLLDLALQAVVPREQRGPDEPIGWTIERCAGSVFVQGSHGARRKNGEVLANCARRMVVRASRQVLFFDLPIASLEAEESCLQLTRAWFNGETISSAANGDGASLRVTRSAIVLQGGGPSRQQPALRATLADSSTLRSSGIDPGRIDASCDATSSFADLDARGFALSLAGRLGDGRKGFIELRGAPHAKGTLTAAQSAEIVPLKGRNLGQLRLPKYGDRELLFPFELDGDGHQRIPLVPIAADARPGDGWFFQAALADQVPGAALLHTTADGGLFDPLPDGSD